MIYLDNAATTFPSEGALAAFSEEARLGANPSSLHRAGYEAHLRLESYRAKVASAIGALCEEICFTSGGTESANIALFGAARALSRRGSRILVSDAEHPCVSECMKALSSEGFEIVTIPTHGGVLDMTALAEALKKPVILAAFMLVNNETGALFCVTEAFAAVKRAYPFALTFCDCVQAFGKVRLNTKTLGADTLSLSAHKIHGVRGVGALFVKKGVRLSTPIHGGGQEKNLRSGTENAPGIAAFAKATEEMLSDFDARIAHVRSLQTRLTDGLSSLNGVRILTAEHSACHIVSAAFDGYKSEVLLHLLSDRGLCVSSGSACSSKKGSKSPILLAHGVPPQVADTVLRFSLSHTTTEEEIDQALSLLSEILQKGLYRR